MPATRSSRPPQLLEPGEPEPGLQGTGLPRRPLLAPGTPVLRRGGGRLQVGLEPAAVVVHHRGACRLLDRLDGHTDLTTLRRLGTEVGITASEVHQLLEALQASELLVGSARPASRGTTAVRLVGLGPLGQQVARLLLTAGLQVYAADERSDREPPAGEEHPGGQAPPAQRTSQPRAVPLADLEDLPRPYGARLVRVNHWSKPEQVPIALTVVALDTVEPDRLVTEALLRADHPHLVLRTAGSGVTVGPLVLPGRTACLRCTDLTRRDADPDWPTLLTQLTALRLATPAALLAWAAGVAVAQVLAHLQGQLPESAGATVELASADHLMRWRAWPVHAACGCAWAATTEWGV